jgi:Tol biopolymer transport system component
MGNHNLWRLKLGGEPQQLTTGPGQNYVPVASPDGRNLAFLSRRTGKSQIWLTDASGHQPTQLTDISYDILGMAFAQDGENIYFVASIDGKGRLMRVPLRGGEPSIVLPDRNIDLWSLSPDSRRIAYTTVDQKTQQAVLRVDVIDTGVTENTFAVDPDNWLSWSADGKALYFVLGTSSTTNIWKQNLAGGPPRQVTAFDDGKQIYRFYPSPDGKTFACIRFKETYDAIALNFDK